MDMDKRTLIGIVLIGLVIMFMYSDFYKKWATRGEFVQDRQEEAVQKQQPLAADSTRYTRQAQKAPGKSRKPVSTAEETLVESIVSDYQLDIQQNEEKIITIETPLYIAKISSRGPSIQSWILKKYFGPDRLPLQLIYGKEGNLSIGLPVQGDTLSLASFPFEYIGHSTSYHLEESSPQQILKFKLNLGENRIVEQTMTFYYDQYSLNMTVNIENMEQVVDGFAYSVYWQGGLNTSEKNIKEDMSYSKAYAYTAEELEDFDVKGDKRKVGGQDGWTVRWAAIRTKYFAAAIIPRNKEGNGIRFYGENVEIAPETLMKKYSIAINIPYLREDTKDDFTVYIGPLQYSIVKSYNVKLEKMMNFGWAIIRPISKLVLWSIKHLYAFIPNYGVVIILFSILVKIIVYPLTKKSYQSMKEMQKIQPEMKLLREKYAKNSQKMNEEMMKLYKKHSVNPVGGCLPMLLQMPLLYSLFIVFRSTIEFRGAEFVWWIKDLSGPDTVFTLPFLIPMYGNSVNVLPIVMGITMFFQQKMTMKDPKQKAMVYIMPFFFTLLFNNFPSGLTLYYTLFNILSIYQQKMVPDEQPDDSAKKTKRRPKSRLDILGQKMRGR